jgi:HEAT repeat protein
MRKIFFLFVISLMAIVPFYTQSADPAVLSFQRNFIRAGIATKIDVLNDASRVTGVNMTPVYADALSFVRQYYPVLGNDSMLIDIAALAAKKIVVYNDPSAVPLLRSTFSLLSDAKARIACIEALASIQADTPATVAFLNDWFTASLGTASGSSDIAVLAAGATALGKIGDTTSFDPLFQAATGTSNAGLALAASVAINALNEGYTDKILGKISEKNIQQTQAAFALAMKNEKLSASDRGIIAEAAFAAATSGKEGDIDAAARDELTSRSLEEIKALRWSQSAPDVTKYFYARQADYRNGKIGMEKLIPVIDCMGTMQSSEAAQALSIFLGLLNSVTEQKKTYDEQLVLAVIRALGDLGDKTAFDYLLYIDYLDYPDSVKKASRDAIARLQW